jgi:hypothetical protein
MPILQTGVAQVITFPQVTNYRKVEPPTADHQFRISDNSLSGDGIQAGDIFTYHPTTRKPRPADVTIIYLKHLRRYLAAHLVFDFDNTVTCLPSNPDFEEITFHVSDIEIIGIRDYPAITALK